MPIALVAGAVSMVMPATVVIRLLKPVWKPWIAVTAPVASVDLMAACDATVWATVPGPACVSMLLTVAFVADTVLCAEVIAVPRLVSADCAALGVVAAKTAWVAEFTDDAAAEALDPAADACAESVGLKFAMLLATLEAFAVALCALLTTDDTVAPDVVALISGVDEALNAATPCIRLAPVPVPPAML